MIVLLSTNDRYTPDFAANGKQWEDTLGAEVMVLEERGHFGSKQQPEVLAAMEKLIKGLGKVRQQQEMET